MEITKEVLDKVFFVDGSFRDIYVLDLNLNDWQRFIDWLYLSDWSIELDIDGEKTTHKITNVAKVFEAKKHQSIDLYIDINGVWIDCHFFSEDEIELVLNPKQIVGLTEASLVFEFMRKLSKLFDKEIILTEESLREYRIVTLKSDGTFFIHV